MIRAIEIINLTNSNSEIVFLPLPQDDPRDRQPDISKANKILNWQPVVSRNEGLKKTIADLSLQLEKMN